MRGAWVEDARCVMHDAVVKLLCNASACVQRDGLTLHVDTDYTMKVVRYINN